MNALELAEEIIGGRRLQRGDKELDELLTVDLTELCQAADKLRATYCGNKVDLCTIINGRSGRCSEDCKYCAQSAHAKTGCKEYAFLPEEVLVAACKANEREGVDRFSIVTSGRSLTGAEFEHALAAYRRMAEECKIDLCASHGFLTREQLHKLHLAGVTSYHDNIETSRRFFPEICSTHTFDQKLETIRAAKEEGLCVCSGGIIGMGETWEDRLDMALTLAELGIESIPVNVLMPIKGTPLGEREILKDDEILRTLAIFRMINPEANIRLAGGRSALSDNGAHSFACGVSATITGNMLTTSGSTIQQDKAMLRGMGRDAQPVWEKYSVRPACFERTKNSAQ